MTAEVAAPDPGSAASHDAPGPASRRRLRETVSLLRLPALRRLFLARTISVLGDMLVPVALAFAVLDFGGGASGLGLVLAARAAPSVVLLLLGGVVGDRYPRKQVLVLTSSIAGIAQTATGLLLVSGSAAVWSIASLVAIRGATSAFFNPTSTAAIVHVAPQDQRQSTFALFTIASNFAEVAGPSIAGVLLLILNPGWVLLLDGATFLVGAVLIAGAGRLGYPAVKKPKQPIRAELIAGLRYVRNTRWLSTLIGSACAFQVFLLATLSVLGPLVARDHLGGSSGWALISAALGAGGILGSGLAIAFHPRRPLLTGYSLLLLGSGPTLLLLAVPAPTPVLALTEFISGVVIAYFGALEATAIAKRVPVDMLSRADSVNRFGSMALRPIGMACIGPIAATIGIRQALVATGVLTLVAVAAPLFVRDVRTLES